MFIKKILVGVAVSVLLLPVSVMAMNGDTSQTGQANQGSSSSSSSEEQSGGNSTDSDSATQSQTQSQTETQTQTNNPGVGTMTQDQARTELQTELQKSKSTYTPTSQATQTRLNAVSSAVQNMLTIASRVAIQNTSLSDKIQSAAQTQIQTQDKINQSLDKAESRSGFSKFFAGPNYKELKTAKQEMEQNRLRIQELNQIVSQITNAADQTELKNQIAILEAQNTDLQEQLNQNDQGFSLFGWLSRWINKY